MDTYTELLTDTDTYADTELYDLFMAYVEETETDYELYDIMMKN